MQIWLSQKSMWQRKAKKQASTLVNPLRRANKSISHVYFKNCYWMDGNQTKSFPSLSKLHHYKLESLFFLLSWSKHTESLRTLPQSTKILISIPQPLLQPPPLKGGRKGANSKILKNIGIYISIDEQRQLFQTECQPTNKIEITMKRRRTSS